MRLTEVGTPVTTTDGDDGELGDDDGSADGGSDFLGGLDAETNVALAVADDNDSLEAGTLTGTGLLLDRLDLLNDSPSVYRSHHMHVSLQYPRTFITSSLSEGRKKSTIWYSLTGRECR